MAKTADGTAALFVLVREDRGSTDVRFLGEFVGNALRPLADVLRQIMRRAPAFIHLDLREVSAVDDDGIKQLVHATRICRRHGGMVKISVDPDVGKAIDAAGAGAALGILARDVREELSTPAGGAHPNGSRRPAPRY